MTTKMAAMSKLRRDPNLTEKLAALIALHLDLPREIAKGMSAKQICELVQWDHYPVAYNIGRDLGWSDTEVHHPTNLQPLFAEDHLEKTRKRDTPQAAKGKRLTRSQEEFRARMLEKVFAEPRDEPPRPAAKLSGRGFQGHRKFNGEVVVRKNGRS